ncbi:MAG: TonB-dependent receptor [Pseudomonadales bacterium]
MKSHFMPAIIAGILLPVMAVNAQEAPDSYEEQIITASPHRKSEKEIAGSVNILDGEALRKEASATLGESLQNQLGVNSSSFGPGVGIPVIRGQSGKRIEILQNSNTVGDVSDLSPDHAVATEALMAERIEILRGPATLRYGSGAIGGVVNIIDNRIHTTAFEGIEGAAEVRHNSNSSESVFVGRLDAGIGRLGLHADAVKRDSDFVEIPGFAAREFDDPDETSFGYIDNSDREADSQGLGISWIDNNLVAGFSVNRMNNNYGLVPGAHDHHEEEHEEEHEGEEHHEEEQEEGHDEELLTRIDMEQTQYQGMLQFMRPFSGISSLDIDFSLTDYAHKELEIEEGVSSIGTRFDVQSEELRAELIHDRMGRWLGALGMQFSRRDFDAIGPEAFAPASETRTNSLYLIEETDLANGTLELGFRADDQRLTYTDGNIDHEAYNFSASYLVPISDTSRLGLVFSHSERNPVAEELLSEGEHIATGTYEIGDPNLSTESSFNAELTWAYESMDANGVSARASIFYSDFSDYIYQSDTELRFSHDLEEDGGSGLAACSDDIADFENNPEEFEESVECFLYVQEGALFRGLEAEISFPIAEFQSLRFWGDMVRATLDQSGDVPRLPPARLGTSWEYAGERWTANISLVNALDQDRPGMGQEATEGYIRLDTYIGYSLDNLLLFARGTNLSNEEIRNSTSFLRDLAPEAGRGITLGARYTF